LRVFFFNESSVDRLETHDLLCLLLLSTSECIGSDRVVCEPLTIFGPRGLSFTALAQISLPYKNANLGGRSIVVDYGYGSLLFEPEVIEGVFETLKRTMP
jgi:hypothetical protein